MNISSIRIAVVEDDLHLRRDLVQFLEHRGFQAMGFESAEAFEEDESSWELVIVDIGLPGQNGYVLLKTLKRNADAPSVVLLTAFGSDEDRVAGLDAGADAYVVKGASLEVIEATCRSVLRARTVPFESSWSLDTGTRTLTTPNGFVIELTHQELSFLRPLMSARGMAISRDQLLGELGSESTLSNLRNLDNSAARLRKKVVDRCGQTLPLRASYGTGYMFCNDSSL